MRHIVFEQPNGRSGDGRRMAADGRPMGLERAKIRSLDPQVPPESPLEPPKATSKAISPPILPAGSAQVPRSPTPGLRQAYSPW